MKKRIFSHRGIGIFVALVSTFGIALNWEGARTFAQGLGGKGPNSKTERPDFQKEGTADLLAAPYTRTTFNGSYTPISTGGGATTSTAVGDDASQGAVPIGFTFNYMGSNFTQMDLCTNGWASFSAPGNISRFNSDLYVVIAPNNVLAPYWDDLTTATGTILYQTQGAAGSQTFTIQWTDVRSYFTGSTQLINFQVILYEGTNIIEFRYGPVTAGTVSPSESASIGIKDVVGGNGNYIDALTGSGNTNSGMLNSSKFPTRFYRFTPGSPTALSAGTYNVGVGQTYPNLSEAVADLNHRGIAGPVTLNLVDSTYDASIANGGNIFPILIGPIAGSSAVNTVTISRTGSPATINSNIPQTFGNFGNQASTSVGSTTNEPVIGVVGADYLTLQNVNLTTGAGTAGADRGLLVVNSSATDGAQNNILRDLTVTLDRANTSSVGVQQNVPTAPSAASGTNSNNKYYNFTIQNVYSGVQLTGNATNPDSAVEVGVTGAVAQNTIGAGTANDIGNGTTQAWGIRATNQSGVKIFNNEVRNVTVTGGVNADGIFLELFQGTSEVFGNYIHDIRNSSTSSTTGIAGIRASHTTTGTHTARVYNNFVYGITSGYTGAATATRQIKGIFVSGTGGGTTQDYQIENNSVRIDGRSSPNISSTAFEISTTSGPVYRVRNNIFSNFTAAQTDPAAHYSWVSTSATSVGNVGSVSDYNDLYVADATQGFVGRGNATDYAGLANWLAAMVGQDAFSISADPLFASATNLHIAVGTSPVIDIGTTIAAITNDIDNQTRPVGANYEIGADEFIPPVAANASISGRVLTANGNGIRNVVVTVSGGNLAEPIRATTGTFGFYRFEGLEVGETYVVTVQSRRFAFPVPSRLVTLKDNVLDADFESFPN